VEVGLARDNGNARIVIYDSGPGISEADRERVFGRFVRLESSRSTPGNGLGLSLVAAVAKLHRADINLGGSGGLEVTISFPLAV
jgi:signal transduction histidine kinase